MLIDIDYSKKPLGYNLLLCKRNEKPITYIEDKIVNSYKDSLVTINELNFSIPKKIENQFGELVENEIYDLVLGDMLIKLNNTDFFIIDSVEEVDSAEGTMKNVLCFSREYELSKKYYRGYKSDSIRLYEEVIPSNWENGGVLNYIEYLSTWRIDTIDSAFLSVYRGVDISKNNIIEVLNQMQQKYGCLFTFDTANKTISVHEPENILTDRGFYISDKKYIELLMKKINYSEIKTRLRVYGENNISIERITPTGKDYIDDFSFYRDNGFMSENLITALDNYETSLSPLEGNFNNLLTDLNNAEAALVDTTVSLSTLENLLEVAKDNYDLAITRLQYDIEEFSSISLFPSSGDLDTIYRDTTTEKEYLWNIGDSSFLEIENFLTVGEARTLVSNAQSNVDNGQIAVDDATTAKDNILINIDSLRSEIADIAITDDALLNELDSFIKEEIYSDSTYKEEMLIDLYNEALNMLHQISQPGIMLETSLIDFSNIVECQHDWDKLNVGDLVTIENESLNFKVQLKIIDYTHNDEANSLVLRLSNKYNYEDPYYYEDDLLGELSSSSTAVDFSKYNWDKAEDAESLISSYISQELNLANQAIITADNQDPIIDNRGIWLRRIEDNNDEDPRQIRMINNIIAITEDNWNTVSTAITGRGISAGVIRGKMGVFAEMDSHQINVTPSSEVEPGSLGDFNGVSINSTDGIKATRADGLVITTLNATNGITINNGSIDVFYADTSGNLKIKGQLMAGSIISESSIEGGSINIGSDGIGGFYFTVDEFGELNATDANISGRITGSEIIGGTVTGSEIFGGSIGIGSDGGGGYYFAVNELGELEATKAVISGSIYGSDFIGGNINIGDGQFNVDSDGILTANSAFIRGAAGIDEFKTDDKIAKGKYLNTTDIEYIHGYDKNIDFIDGDTNGTLEQLVEKGVPLYWTDSTEVSITSLVTDYPVMVYNYDESVKMSLKFGLDLETGYKNPMIEMGEGDGVLPNSSKGRIFKDANGVKLEYYKSNTAEKVGFYLTDDGVYCSDVLHNLIPVQGTAPENPEEGDFWVDTNETEVISDEQGGELVGGGDTELHTHDDRYYTEIEIDGTFSNLFDNLDVAFDEKADVLHQHIENDITDLDKYTQLETDNLLNGKSDTTHTHSEEDITDLDKYTQAEIQGIVEDIGRAITPQLMTYTHTQSVASDEWIITHNLEKYPSVTIVDSAGSEVETDIEYVNSNTIKSISNGAFGGKAYLN